MPRPRAELVGRHGPSFPKSWRRRRCGAVAANVKPHTMPVRDYRVRMKMFPNAKEHRTPVACSAGSWHLPWRMEDHVKFSPRRSPVARAVRVLEFYVPSFGAAMLSGAPSADDACCSATALHCSGLRSGATVAAATSAGVMRAHFGARYTWPHRCCAGCRTAVADTRCSRPRAALLLDAVL